MTIVVVVVAIEVIVVVLFWYCIYFFSVVFSTVYFLHLCSCMDAVCYVYIQKVCKAEWYVFMYMEIKNNHCKWWYGSINAYKIEWKKKEEGVSHTNHLLIFYPLSLLHSTQGCWCACSSLRGRRWPLLIWYVRACVHMVVLYILNSFI